MEDVERFFKETIENRDEGIVLKDLSSKWEPGDRSGKWLKLKPDYIHAGADLDVLIIGGYFGSGRHGGEVAQFLVGLAERPDSTSFPKRFLSFCRVGTGLSDEDLYILITRLKPYLRKNEQPKRSPLCYVVTNNSKERPDVWVESPDKSVILSIASDIRTIKSEVFAAPYSLRFPRIQRVRYDKPWHECLDVESFRDLVHSSNGTTQRGANQGELQQANEAPKRSVKKGDKRNISVISTRSIQLDVSSAKKTMLFSNMMFYFANIPPSYSLDYFHKLVIENGGNVSMNLNETVTHSIAAEKKGIKYQAATRHGDIIHFSWVLSCCNQKKLVNIQPKYFLFFADSSKKQRQEEVDAFSDYFYWDIDIEDLKQIFCNMIEYGNSSSNLNEHYMKKYIPVRRMSLFHGCFIYLHQIPPWDNSFEVISEMAMRRMKLEISMHGGKIDDDLESATHLLVYSTFESYDFDQIYESVPEIQRQLLHRKELHVLRHNWLEESLNKTSRLPEHDYSLRPYSFKKLIVEEKAIPVLHEDQSAVASRNTKRGRQAAGRGRAGAGRPALRPARRTRAKIGKHSVKLRSDGSESADSMEAAPSADAAAQTKEEEETGSEIADEPDIKQECVLENEAGDKLGLMADPIQAMLFDMIPSLSQNQKGRIDTDPVSVSHEKKPLAETEEEVPNPAKKKKVSYKDVAGELLKDF